MKTIAIIGAGLSGLTLAAKLKQSLPGVDIQLFEKARGPGGRMSTRRAAQNGIEFSFDHGAQFFTARSGAFREFLSPYINEGIVAPWQIDIEKENVFVGAPAMNAICKSLASGLNVRTGAQVQDLTRGPQGWILDIDSAQAGPFDLVVSSAPAPQTSILFEDYFAYQNALAAIQYQPCFALMLGFSAAKALDWKALRPRTGGIGWIGINSSKPGRDNTQTTITIHTKAEWAQDHVEENADDLLETIRDMAQAFLPFDLADANFAAAHKWRYANVHKPLSAPGGAPYLYDAESGLAAIGDWCQSGRVEAAFESANALAEHLSA